MKIKKDEGKNIKDKKMLKTVLLLKTVFCS